MGTKLQKAVASPKRFTLTPTVEPARQRLGMRAALRRLPGERHSSAFLPALRACAFIPHPERPFSRGSRFKLAIGD